jgi:hypothetical protein
MRAIQEAKDVDGRVKPGHDDAVKYPRISINVMAGFMPAIHVFLTDLS